uniref:Uncharacterized protein n=1 Tax=Ralstonia solanacearum CFBP2957 TaxID=859656 RepID=D8P3B2_RALSL|nr:protein of unknown function [Ralstonia solanacearum CFBP2957]
MMLSMENTQALLLSALFGLV